MVVRKVDALLGREYLSPEARGLHLKASTWPQRRCEEDFFQKLCTQSWWRIALVQHDRTRFRAEKRLGFE